MDGIQEALGLVRECGPKLKNIQPFKGLEEIREERKSP